MENGSGWWVEVLASRLKVAKFQYICVSCKMAHLAGPSQRNKGLNLLVSNPWKERNQSNVNKSLFHKISESQIINQSVKNKDYLSKYWVTLSSMLLQGRKEVGIWHPVFHLKPSNQKKFWDNTINWHRI